jgi:hypothetical protein
MDKSQKPDADKLLVRIQELEEQLGEEREEFEWDLKTAKEAHERALKKLKEENERLMLASARPSAQSESEQVRMLTERAMQAEARVSELMEERKRASERALTGTKGEEEAFLRRRAEAAEKARDALQETRVRLERKLRESEAKLRKAGKSSGAAAQPGLQKEVDGLRARLAVRETAVQELSARVESLVVVEEDRDRLARELKELRSVQEQPVLQPGADAELERLRGELTAREEELRQASASVQEKEAALQEVAGKLDSLSDVEAERDRLARELEEIGRAHV